MIKFIDVGSEKIVGCIINGKINTDDIQKISVIVEEKAKKFEKLNVYVEVVKLQEISLEALLKDIKLAIKHFSKFNRKAVVTDKKWMQTITPLVDKIFPNIEVKCFSFTERDKAQEWINS